MLVSKLTEPHVFIGLDWADKKHDICYQEGAEYINKIISSKSEHIHEWLHQLHLQFKGKKIIIAYESGNVRLLNQLCQYNFVLQVPIPPQQVKRYRDAFSPSGAKDDPTDAKLILDLIQRHSEHFNVLKPESSQIRELSDLVEFRRRQIDQRVKVTNKIRSLLKRYYPQPLEIFNELDSIIFCDFLTKWPDPIKAKTARKDVLLRFFKNHNSRYSNINAERIETIKSLTVVTDDQAVIRPCSMLLTSLINELRCLLVSTELFDQHIKKLTKSIPEYKLFKSLPGAGEVNAARLLAALGTNKKKYKNASEMLCYMGVAPVTQRSGKSCIVRWRYQCPTFLRQTLVEWAGQTIRSSAWARAYYQMQIGKGKHHNAAIRALAYKWGRILYRCWQKNSIYDEAKYITILSEKRSPIISYLASR
ncbi:MAG: transposase [Cocleimonas sp.]|jgi:transposase